MNARDRPSTFPFTRKPGSPLDLLAHLGQQHPLYLSFLVVSVLFAVTLTVFTQRFETNDDVQMWMMVTGVSTAEGPDERIVFSHVAIGWLLKTLYLWTPAIPWYALYLVGAQFVAHVGLVYSAVSHKFQPRSLLLYLLYFATVGIQFLTKLQFTTTAFLCGQAGALLLISLLLLDRQADSSFHVRRALASVLLLVTAFLIRNQCLFMVGLLAGPVVIVLVAMRPTLARFTVSAGVAGTVATLAVVLGSFERDYYERTDPQWRSDYESLVYIGKLVSDRAVPYTTETKPIYDAVHWSATDYEMLMRWWFFDQEVFSTEKVRKIVEAGRKSRPLSLGNAIASAVFVMERYAANYLLMLSAAVGLYALFGHTVPRWCRLSFAAAMIASLLLACTLPAIGSRVPDRILYSLASFPFALAVCMTPERLARQAPAATRGKWRSTVTVGLALFASAIILTGHYRETRFESNFRRNLMADLAAIGKVHCWQSWGPGFPYEALSPFASVETLESCPRILWGPFQRTTMFRDLLRSQGINDPYRALWENSQVLLVARAGDTPHLEDYLTQHYHVDAKMQPVFSGTCFSAYQCRLRNGTSDQYP